MSDHSTTSPNNEDDDDNTNENIEPLSPSESTQNDVEDQNNSASIQTSSLDINDNILNQEQRSSRLKWNKDEKESLYRLQENLRPLNSLQLDPNPRPLAVFNVFNKVWDFFKPEPPRRGVRFADIVIEKAEERGEVMTRGMMHDIPSYIQEYRPVVIKGKQKADILYLPRGFHPRLTNIEDSTCIERMCESCRRKRYKPTTLGPPSSPPPKLSLVMNGFFYSINVAGDFIENHQTKTFLVALPLVDVYKNPKEPQTVSSQQNINSKFEAPLEEIEPNFDARIGLLASQIWIFSRSVSLLLVEDREKPEFIKILIQFRALAKKSKQYSEQVIKQGRKFHIFIAECMRAIDACQYILNFEGDTSYSKPPHKGVLELKKHSKNSVSGSSISNFKDSSLVICICKAEDEETGNEEWSDFKQLDIKEKLKSLKYLLNVTEVKLNDAMNQVNLLVNDIVETTKDLDRHNKYYDHDLLFRIGDMYERLKLDPKREKGYNSYVYTQSMEQFTNSLAEFRMTAEHIFAKIMELLDMIELVFVYLKDSVGIDIDTSGFSDKDIKMRCCGRRSKVSRGDYKAEDFYRTFIEDAMDCRISAGPYTFQIASSLEELQMKSERPSAVLSVPSTMIHNLDPNLLNKSDDSIHSGEFATPPEPVLKSILKNIGSSEEVNVELDLLPPPPVPVPPRKSKDVTVTPVKEDDKNDEKT